MDELPQLTDHERAIYEWQMWIPGFGEAAQRRLKASTVLISRVGGVGGLVAYQLAAAGVGRLILAHAGNIKPSDLNRQLLMTELGIGQSRLDSAKEKLLDLNPRCEIVCIPENISESNAARLVAQADIVASCAPMFEERLALNAASVALGKPMVDGAMYELTGQLMSIAPGQSGCLACLVPEVPRSWKRQFPVLGAVSGTIGCLIATEIVKILTGLGDPLYNHLLTIDLRTNHFKTRHRYKNPTCPVCGTQAPN